MLIKHYGPAHTDGDLYVYFKKADVLRHRDMVLEQASTRS